MDRRQFMSSFAAASALAADGGRLDAQTTPQSSSGGASGREYYQLRKYRLLSGPQTKLTNAFVEQAFIPALNRMGIPKIGAFTLDIGPETPVLYVLIPSTSLEDLVNVDFKVARDEEFLKAAEPFWKAPAKEPPFVRAESSLMIAFEGWPKITLPPVSAQRGKRVFQLRTYESPSNFDHIRKVEMFHSGEFEVFQKAGFWQVFYGDTLIGDRLPNLTYMLSFPDLSEMNDKWNAFRSDPQWKKLSSNPRFNFEAIVTNISNLVLMPASYSQI